MDELEAKDGIERYEDGFDAGYEKGRTDTLRLVAGAFVRRISGQWPDDAADPTVPLDWEKWALVLHGEEAGDVLDGEEGRAHFLKLFGFLEEAAS